MRLALSRDKKVFFKNNILDLLAVMPFNSLYKMFHVFKILKILKFFFEINGLKHMVFLRLVCIALGGVAIHFIEDMSFFDGLWWSFAPATTVGYVDKSEIIMALQNLAVKLYTSSLPRRVRNFHPFERAHGAQTEKRWGRNIMSQRQKTSIRLLLYLFYSSFFIS